MSPSLFPHICMGLSPSALSCSGGFLPQSAVEVLRLLAIRQWEDAFSQAWHYKHSNSPHVVLWTSTNTYQTCLNQFSNWKNFTVGRSAVFASVLWCQGACTAGPLLSHIACSLPSKLKNLKTLPSVWFCWHQGIHGSEYLQLEVHLEPSDFALCWFYSLLCLFHGSLQPWCQPNLYFR